MDLQKKQLTAS